MSVKSCEKLENSKVLLTVEVSPEDFEAAWQDVLEGCQGLLKELTARRWGEDG